MPKYEVVSESGYWDGVRLHSKGSILDLKEEVRIGKPQGEYQPSLKPHKPKPEKAEAA